MLILNAATVASGLAKPEELASKLGFAFWTLAYFLFIVKGFQGRTYGVPLVAICLNVTWELYFAVLCPGSIAHANGLCTASGSELWGLILWLVLDVIIFCQLLAFGSNQPWLQQYLPARARLPVFYVMVFGLFFLALAWQYLFISVKADKDGNSLAWITNLIMSLLFVRSAIARPTLSGLSFAGAGAMLAGNLAFMASGFLTRFADFTVWSPQVTAALMFAVILVNLFYLLVLWYRTRQASFGGPVPQQAL
jgi:uncharacterized membrane protein